MLGCSFISANIKEHPDDDEAHRLKGKIYLEQGKPVKALASMRKAYELASQQVENGQGVILAYLELGLLEEAKEFIAELLKTNLDDIGLLQLSIQIARYGDTAMQAAAKTDILRLAEKLKATTIEVPAKHIHQVVDHDRLHIGVLINERAMTENIDFLDAWFQAYDNESLNIVGYQLYERPDIGHSRLKNLVDDWREAFDLDDTTFKHVLYNDGIDVLLDLCGIDEGNRLEILASGLGACRDGWLQGARSPHAGTLDKVLCDDLALSVENGDIGRVSLGVGQIAFRGGSFAPEKKLEVVSHGSAPVFGAVLDMMSVMPSLQLWGEVLSAIPDASLVLGRAGGFEAELRDHLKNHFAVCGIEGRVEFVSDTLGRKGGANLLSKIDVLLDNVVVNGTTSTCDALWMGIPVISLSSTDRHGINGASILTAAGCEDWIAYDTKKFVTIAEGLVGEQKVLEEVCRNLQERIKKSPLCNLVEFANRMETALRQAYEAHAH